MICQRHSNILAPRIRRLHGRSRSDRPDSLSLSVKSTKIGNPIPIIRVAQGSLVVVNMIRVAGAEWLLRHGAPADWVVQLCARVPRSFRPVAPIPASPRHSPSTTIEHLSHRTNEAIRRISRWARDDFAITAAAVSSQVTASAEGKRWFHREFVEYNIEVYLPHLVEILATKSIPRSTALPKFCRLPDDGAYQPWHSTEEAGCHPGVQALVGSIDRVRDELAAVRPRRIGYNGVDSSWTVNGFRRFGTTNTELCRACPVTWRCLQKFALKDCWGEVLVSTLSPQSGLPIHTGESGLNLICHIGIDIPDGDLGLVVDGEMRRWAEGEAVLFNDSFPHTAYNLSEAERTVLLVEHWNPAAPHDSRQLLAAFMATWSAIAPPSVLWLNEIDSRFDFDTSGFTTVAPRRPSTPIAPKEEELPWERFMD